MNPSPPLKKSNGGASFDESLSPVSFKTNRSRTTSKANAHATFWMSIASRNGAPSFIKQAVKRSATNGYENFAPAHDGFTGGKFAPSVKLNIAPR